MRKVKRPSLRGICRVWPRDGKGRSFCFGTCWTDAYVESIRTLCGRVLRQADYWLDWEFDGIDSLLGRRPCKRCVEVARRIVEEASHAHDNH